MYCPRSECQSGCLFCHPLAGTTTGRASVLPILERLRRRADSHIGSWNLPTGSPVPTPSSCHPPGAFELGFYGGLLSRNSEEISSAMELAIELAHAGFVKSLRLTVQPIDLLQGKLELLPKALPLILELDVPSLAPSVYLQQAAHHHPSAVREACTLIRARAIRWGIQLTPGLPGSTPARELETLAHLMELHPQTIRITPALVLKGTFLEQLYTRGLYSPWNLDESVQCCLTMLQTLERNGIPVIRMGLQPSRDLQKHSAQVVAGPYHPSLRTLVQALDMRQRLESLLSHQLVAGHRIALRVHPACQTAVRGPENENFRWVCRRFHCTSVHIRLDPSLHEGVLELEGIEPATFEGLQTHRPAEQQKGTQDIT